MESYALGKTLVQQAQGKLGSAVPADVAVVFASSNQNYTQLMKGMRELARDIPIIGCSTAGEFTEDGYSTDGAVCAFIRSTTHRFSLGIGQYVKDDPEKAIKQAIAQFETTREYPHRVALMFVDGLAGCGDDLVSMTAHALGADVKVAGGAAGDNLAFRATHILYNGQAYTNSVGLCMIHSKVPVRTAATHGHYPFGDVMTITKAQPRRVYEIDRQNAWKIWLDASRQRREELGFTDEALKSQELQSRFFPCFEMGLVTKQGGYKLRGIMTAYPDGSLGLYSDVSEGNQFRIMYSDKAAQLNALERAANLAMAHKPKNPAGALIFDCVVRSSILGDEFYPSIQSFHRVLQGVPFIGFETYGEICLPSLFFEGFLNTTSVVVILPD
jgi:hypothetical protein